MIGIRAYVSFRGGGDNNNGLMISNVPSYNANLYSANQVSAIVFIFTAWRKEVPWSLLRRVSLLLYCLL